MKKFFTTAIAYCLLLYSFSLRAQSNCLVGDYQLNGNANDNSINAINGIVTGATLTSDRNSNANSAYSFDGNDYITAGVDGRGITNQVSVTAWVKTTSAVGAFIVGKYNYTTNRGFHLAMTNGKATVGGRDGSGQYRLVASNVSINDGVWHFLTGVCTGTAWQIYVDGKLEGELVTNYQSTNLANTDPLTIGYYYQGSAEGDHAYFTGTIDEVKVYKCALTKEEIVAMSEADCLVGDFEFTNNGNDISNIAINGIVTGATLTSDRNSIANSAYSFDGSDYITAGVDGRGITNQVSVTAWVKTTSAVGAFIVGKYNYTTNRGFHLAMTNGKATVGGRDGSGQYRLVASNVSINDGVWHFLAGVCTGTAWQIYVDGKLEGELVTNYQTTNLANTDPLTIGYYYQGSAEGDHAYFTGAIDEVKVYKCALTAEEIGVVVTSNNTEFTENNKEISVYPIPTTSLINIQTTNNELSTLEIINAQGRSVMNRSFVNQLNISELVQGFYIVQMKDKDGNVVYSKRIVKE